jgi:mono/diheme cytochrome c family protein
MLQHARIHHGNRNQDKSGEDAADGIEVDFHFSQPGVDDEVEEGNEDDQGNRIEVLQEVVGRAVQCHGPGLRDEVVPDLDPADEVEGEEEEDLEEEMLAVKDC